VADVTKFPEMMEGRVKTLHPMVHGGLLAKRDHAEHLAAMAAHHIPNITMLVVNLYPFAATLAKTSDPKTLIENIDVGGPTMLRAAAKNHAHVTVVTDPEDYARVAQAVTDGEISLTLKRELAAKTFAHTAAYDSLIASWMAQQVLSYGENPHQQAALYRRVSEVGGVAAAAQLHGKALSYNNLQDADAAWNMVVAHATPTLAIIKHMNPCGVGQGAGVADAFRKALACDPVSAFGGVIAFGSVDCPRF
jgi:phosphoribosylaminoimidazolecarboxamide formyltransferase / IMP cyclohydrolase